MKVFITGISGRVGANLAFQLLKRGYEVRGLIFPGDPKTEKVRKLGVEIAEADMLGNAESIDDHILAFVKFAEVGVATRVASLIGVPSRAPNPSSWLFRMVSAALGPRPRGIRRSDATPPSARSPCTSQEKTPDRVVGGSVEGGRRAAQTL